MIPNVQAYMDGNLLIRINAMLSDDLVARIPLKIELRNFDFTVAVSRNPFGAPHYEIELRSVPVLSRDTISHFWHWVCCTWPHNMTDDGRLNWQPPRIVFPEAGTAHDVCEIFQICEHCGKANCEFRRLPCLGI